MRLLAIDTSTPTAAVALHDGDALIAERAVSDARKHGELVAPLVDEVLAAVAARPADLSAIAVGLGPGPYTGLRVGIVTAKVMGEALGIPVYGVCSLDGFAVQAVRERLVTADEQFAVLTDARRKEVYWARYRDSDRLEGPGVDKPAVLAPDLSCAVVGPGAALYSEQFADIRGDLVASAGALAEVALPRVAAGEDADELRPLYLRRPDTSGPGSSMVS